VRSHMQVWAADPADAVLWAGGLICDHALDGWDVMVLLPNPSNSSALQILGAKVDVHDSHSAPTDSAHPVVTISAASDDPDREPQPTCYVCGPFEEYGYGFRHRLSAGARAFKAHALRAAGLSADVASTELFRPAMPIPLSIVRGRIDRWQNAGQCNDASNTPETCC